MVENRKKFRGQRGRIDWRRRWRKNREEEEERPREIQNFIYQNLRNKTQFSPFVQAVTLSLWYYGISTYQFPNSHPQRSLTVADAITGCGSGSSTRLPIRSKWSFYFVPDTPQPPTPCPSHGPHQACIAPHLCRTAPILPHPSLLHQHIIHHLIQYSHRSN